MDVGMRSGLKVVHVINRLIGGGAEVMVAQIHECHRAAGVDSWIVSMETGDRRGTGNVRAFGRKYPRWREPFLLGRELRAIEGEGRIDILHTHLTQSQVFGKIAARLAGIRPRMVTTEHDTSNRRRSLPGGRWLDRAIYSGYDRIICISEAVRDSMRSWQRWIPEERLVVVENGVPLEPFRAARGLRREAGAEGALRLISVGRLIPKKGFDRAIEILAGLKDLEWTYTLVGEGESREGLEQLAAQHGIAERVRFRGAVEDVASELGEADISLIPSRWEGFGLVAVEAMAAGLVVVASDVPGLADVVGPAGVVLAGEDFEAWRETLRRLAGEKAERERWGEAAAGRAEHYRIEETAESYLKVYRELMEGVGS